MNIKKSLRNEIISHLESIRSKTNWELFNNKSKINDLAKSQSELKKKIADTHRLIVELKRMDKPRTEEKEK